MIEVQLPAMVAGQAASWREFIQFAKIFPEHWTLVGGQLIHLHCWERGEVNNRATTDVDTVIDIKAVPSGLLKVTSQLELMGFEAATETSDGHQISWLKGDARIDVLIAEGTGPRAEARVGVRGATTLPTPGGQEALNHSEKVLVRYEGEEGVINRPSLVGAMIIKSAAASNSRDLARKRHVSDLARLFMLYGVRDAEEQLSSKEIVKIQNGLGIVERQISDLEQREEVQEALTRVKLGINS